MPFRRRRPLLRAAAVGGGAYLAGKHSAQRQAEQDQPIDDTQQQPAAAPAADGPQPAASVPDQLNQLADLRKQGVLSDDEFTAAKAKLLGT